MDLAYDPNNQIMEHSCTCIHLVLGYEMSALSELTSQISCVYFCLPSVVRGVELRKQQLKMINCNSKFIVSIENRFKKQTL